MMNFRRLRPAAGFGAVLLAFAALPAAAQPVVDQGEHLDDDRPEAWAMAYLGGSTLFSGFGPAREEAPWTVSLGAEAGHIPHLSARQRRVGFNGTKLEDLNKSPVFGRIRLGVALPARLTLELSWTPPVEIDGARAREFFGIAVERPLIRRGPWRSAARVFYQHGAIEGDITCDRATASHPPGSAANPFGCRAPSDDRFTVDQRGLELSVSRSFRQGRIEPYLAYTLTDMNPRTRVDARVFSVIDRSVLTADITTHTATAGLIYRPAENWELLGAMAWTPLHVRRQPTLERARDDLWSARLMLRRTWR